MRCGQGSGKKAMCLEQKRAKRQEGPHRTRPGLEAQGSQPLVVRGYVVIQSIGTVAHQALLSMEFSRQEYWSGLSFPSPGDLPKPRDHTLVSCIGGGVSSD